MVDAFKRLLYRQTFRERLDVVCVLSIRNGSDGSATAGEKLVEAKIHDASDTITLKDAALASFALSDVRFA
jgi:hypothetical protein